MKKILLVIAVVCGMLGAARAQSSSTTAGDFTKAGASGALILKMPVGARAIGMGGAVSGQGGDLTSLFWNPAGIAGIRDNSVAFEYASSFADITNGFIAGSLPVSTNYTLAASITFLSTGGIPITTILQQDGNGATFTASDLVLGLTFAGSLTDRFSFGFTGKLVRNGLYNLTASGLAFDVGTLYRTDFYNMTFGLSICNLGTQEQYTGDALLNPTTYIDPQTGKPVSTGNSSYLPTNEFNLPLLFRAGVALDLLGEVAGVRDQKLLFSTDFVTLSDNPEKVNLGAEYWWEDLVALRAGYQAMSDEYDYSAGAGLKYETGTFHGTIDYAYAHTKNLGGTHRIGIGMRFK